MSLPNPATVPDTTQQSARDAPFFITPTRVPTTKMSNEASPRVNSSMLSRFIGKKVRLPCKVLTINKAANRATVQASDGGDVEIQAFVEDPGVAYIEVIGMVVDETTVKSVGVIKFGDNLDMSTVEATIKIIHDPRFVSVFFP